jgi:zinc protease
VRVIPTRLRPPRAAGLLLAAAILIATAGRTRPAAATALADTLRLDPLVRTGTLANGLTYYIRHNAKPEHRVSLRLVLDAGSTSETDAQRGLAHFSEHMNFDGSRHFAPEELIAYLQSIGMRFGSDANAYTSFDETVYMLEVPTDRDTLLDRGLTALADFAGGALFDTAQVRKERSVVIEEWRLGRGANERMFRKTIPVVFHGSRYAVRDPIGLPEVIRNTPTARIREFYDRWYTPDRMAVVAVGDIDPARMDSLVRAHFGGLGRPAPPAARATLPIPLHRRTLVAIATDPEATWSSVQILFKHPRHLLRTVADFRRRLVEQLIGAMLQERLQDIAHRTDPPFLSAGASSGDLGRTVDTWYLWASTPDGGLGRGLAALLAEARRARTHGFLASELERARENLRQQNASRYAERDKQESEQLAGRYVDVFLSGDPSVGVEAAHALVGDLLDGITLAEVDALAAELMHHDSRVVVLNAPEKKGVPVPTEAEVRRILARAESGAVAAWQERAPERALMPRPPQPGAITSRRTIDSLGVTILGLSNGAEVWLKPTDFKADEVLIAASAPGGLSTADSARYLTAWASEWLIAHGGYGGLSSTAMKKVLAGKLASMQPWAGAYTQGVSGRARPADLETAFQLLYLVFTTPTGDSADFATPLQSAVRFYANRDNEPEQVFADTLAVVNSGGFYMYQPVDARALAAVRLDSLLAVHRRRFANAADYTFFVVGAFQPDSIAPLLARYVASLPSAGRPTSAWAAIGPRFPAGVQRRVVRRGTEPKSETEITFFTNPPLEELDMHRARAAASILEDRLRQRLRELMGGTYGASVGFSNLAPLPGYATMTIEFGCEPARVDSMVAATLDEVRRVVRDGPSAADVQKDQEIERRELEVAEKENGTWLGLLQNFHAFGWDPLRILHRRERIDRLTRENLRATFAKYFPLDRYTVITLLPAAGAGRP